jgi:hypothetical protein
MVTLNKSRPNTNNYRAVCHSAKLKYNVTNMSISKQRFGNTRSRGNGYAGKNQSVATGLTHVS